LTVTGTNFTSTSVVDLGDQQLTTTFVSSTQITAAVPASDVAIAGDQRVYVVDGSTYSNSEGFTVTKPAATPPTISNLSPTTCVAGSATFTLTITGTNFLSTSKVYFYGYVPTTFVSATELTAAVPASAVAKAGNITVAVVNDGHTGKAGMTTFVVTPGAATPAVLKCVSPSNCLAGSSGLTITVKGSNFATGSVVNFGTTGLTTTYISTTQLTAAIPAALVATAGKFPVTVANPSVAASNAINFCVRSAIAARTVYLFGQSGTTGSDDLDVLFGFKTQSAPDFTQDVALQLVNPAYTDANGNTVAAVTVYSASNLILTPTSTTLDNGRLDVYQYQTGTLLLTIVELDHNVYGLQACASDLDLSAIDTTQPVAITLTVGSQAFTTQVQPYTLGH
jgi:hypothetical protein